MRQFLMVMKAQFISWQSNIIKEFHSIFFEKPVGFFIRSFFAESLILHLLKFNGTECEIPGRYFIAKSLPDLSDTKRKSGPCRTHNIQIINIFTLCIFRSKKNCTVIVLRYTSLCCKHEIELTDICKILFSAYRTLYFMFINICHHFFLCHPIYIGRG